jgi:hypothetical protein
MLPVSFWRSHGRTERQFSSLQIIKHRMVTKNFSGFFLLWVSIYELEQFGSRAVPAHLPVFNIVRIPIPVPASPARAAARLKPPAQYNHAYNGQVVERVMPETEVRSVCMSMGLDSLTVACSWQSNDTCYVVIPNDGQAPVDTYRRHEIAYCNGWPADHPHDG